MAIGGPPASVRGRDTSRGAAGRHAFVLEVARGYLGPLWIAHDPADPGANGTTFVRHVAPIAVTNVRAALLESLRWGQGAKLPDTPAALEVVEGKTSLDVVSPAVPGEVLRTLLRTVALKHVPTEPGLLFGVARALLSELQALHEYAKATSSKHGFGGVHPDSVFIDTDGRVMLLDVGVSAAASAREPWRADPQRMGYMAPEQLEARAVADARTDVFAVGVILWEALTNRRLFPGNDAKTVRERLQKGAIARLDTTRSSASPGIATPFSDVVARALEREPEKRFASADEMARAIAALEHADRPRIAEWVSSSADAAIVKRRQVVERARAGLSLAGDSMPPPSPGGAPRASQAPTPSKTPRPSVAPAPSKTPRPSQTPAPPKPAPAAPAAPRAAPPSTTPSPPKAVLPPTAAPVPKAPPASNAPAATTPVPSKSIPPRRAHSTPPPPSARSPEPKAPSPHPPAATAAPPEPRPSRTSMPPRPGAPAQAAAPAASEGATAATRASEPPTPGAPALEPPSAPTAAGPIAAAVPGEQVAAGAGLPPVAITTQPEADGGDRPSLTLDRPSLTSDRQSLISSDDVEDDYSEVAHDIPEPDEPAERVGEAAASPPAAPAPMEEAPAAETTHETVEPPRSTKRPPELPASVHPPAHGSADVLGGTSSAISSPISISPMRALTEPARDRGRAFRVGATVAALVLGIVIGGVYVARRRAANEAAEKAAAEARMKQAHAVSALPVVISAPVPESAPSASAEAPATSAEAPAAPAASPTPSESPPQSAHETPKTEAPRNTEETRSSPSSGSESGKRHGGESHNVPNAGYKPGGI